VLCCVVLCCAVIFHVMLCYVTVYRRRTCVRPICRLRNEDSTTRVGFFAIHAWGAKMGDKKLREKMSTRTVSSCPCSVHLLPEQYTRSTYIEMGIVDEVRLLLRLYRKEKTKKMRPSDRRLLAKSVPNPANRGCHVVSVTDPHGCILGLLDRVKEPLGWL
jgi:hypothetical protein